MHAGASSRARRRQKARAVLGSTVRSRASRQVKAADCHHQLKKCPGWGVPGAKHPLAGGRSVRTNACNLHKDLTWLDKILDGRGSSWSGLLAAGERLRPEDQPRQLFGDHPQLVLRAGFVEPVDHRDQRADMLLG